MKEGQYLIYGCNCSFKFDVTLDINRAWQIVLSLDKKRVWDKESLLIRVRRLIRIGWGLRVLRLRWYITIFLEALNDKIQILFEWTGRVRSEERSSARHLSSIYLEIHLFTVVYLAYIFYEYVKMFLGGLII